MDDIRECYQILDLEPGASIGEIRRSYRELVRIWHPDRFGNDAKLRAKAEEKLKRINLAYERLCKEAQTEGMNPAAKQSRSRVGTARVSSENNRQIQADQGIPLSTATNERETAHFTRWMWVAAAVVTLLIIAVMRSGSRQVNQPLPPTNSQSFGKESLSTAASHGSSPTPSERADDGVEERLASAWRLIRRARYSTDDNAALEDTKKLFKSYLNHSNPTIAYQGEAGLAAIAAIQAGAESWALFPVSSHPMLERAKHPIYADSSRFWPPFTLDHKQSSPYGYINAKGYLVIPITKDYEEDYGHLLFSEGLAVVKKGLKKGYVDSSGILIAIEPAWFLARSFAEGLASVTDTRLQTGFINRAGRLVISDAPGALWFSEGLAAVKVEGKYGYIDRHGKLVIPAVWEEANERFGRTGDRDFHEGLACVTERSQWGYIDRSGELVIPADWDRAHYFNEGLAAVKQYGKWGYIDRAGKLMTAAVWDSASDFRQGLADVKLDGKKGVIDRDGKIVVRPEWEAVYPSADGAFQVKRDGKWGCLDGAGNLVIPLVWDEMNQFSGGLAAVKRSGKWGYINSNGALVIPAVWDYADAFSEGLAAIEQSGKWGYIDPSGKLVVPAIWDYAERFSNRGGIAAVYQWSDKAKPLSDSEPIPARMLYIDKKGMVIWSSSPSDIGQILMER